MLGEQLFLTSAMVRLPYPLHDEYESFLYPQRVSGDLTLRYFRLMNQGPGLLGEVPVGIHTMLFYAHNKCASIS